MLTLYYGSGSRTFSLGEEECSDETLRELLTTARAMLRARNEPDAERLLARLPFCLFEGVNDFNDDFSVLVAYVPLPVYEDIRVKDMLHRRAGKAIAEVLIELGVKLRFVSVGLARQPITSWDVFLCHASEDKDTVVGPLVSALEAAGFRCWYDRGEILWGDSIIDRVEEGLRNARFVIVVLSPTFLSKRWPMKELRAVLSSEIETGSTRVLALMVGTERGVLAIRQALALQRDKRHLLWTGDPQRVIEELQRLVARDVAPA